MVTHSGDGSYLDVDRGPDLCIVLTPSASSRAMLGNSTAIDTQLIDYVCQDLHPIGRHSLADQPAVKIASRRTV